MSDFSKAKVGDEVYCLKNGYGKITHVNNTEVYADDTITVRFTRNIADYLLSGYLIEAYEHHDKKLLIIATSTAPLLYWSKPEIIEKKRKVKKSGWINIFRREGGDPSLKFWLGYHVYDSYENATNCGVKSNEYSTTVKIEFEVEE